MLRQGFVLLLLVFAAVTVSRDSKAEHALSVGVSGPGFNFNLQSYRIPYPQPKVVYGAFCGWYGCYGYGRYLYFPHFYRGGGYGRRVSFFSGSIAGRSFSGAFFGRRRRF